MSQKEIKGKMFKGKTVRVGGCRKGGTIFIKSKGEWVRRKTTKKRSKERKKG